MSKTKNADTSKQKQFKEGDIVKMFGLKSKQDWNGKLATIVGPFVKKKNRWPIQINFGDRSRALLQAKNLKLGSSNSSNNTLKQLANGLFESFMKARRDNLYPHKDIESFFGIEMDKGQLVEIGNPFGNKEYNQKMPLGNVVYNAWITISNNQQLDRKQVVNALCDGSLPKWFEEKIRNNGSPQSYYAKALCDGNLFGRIKWKRLKIENIQKENKNKANDLMNVVEIQSNRGYGVGPLGNKLRNTRFTLKEFQKFTKKNGLTRKIKSEFAALLGFDLYVMYNPKSSDKENNAGSVFLTSALSSGMSPYQRLHGNSIVICTNKTITSDRLWGILNFIWDAMDYYDGTIEMTADERRQMFEYDSQRYKEEKWEPRGGCGGIDIYNDDATTCKIPSF